VSGRVALGRVVLVGAGPGDPDLLTLRAARELERAEVLMFDALIDPAILELAAPDCERIDVGKRGDGTRGFPQENISDLMIRKAREGRYVVRLKGGDPFVFGRGGEEATALASAGIPFEVVPGIPSPVAVPAYAGIPVTDRRLSSSVAVVTGHRGKDVEDRRIDWEGLSRSADTLVILMGTAWLEDIVRRVIAGGRDPSTPAAVIERGTTPRQRVVAAPLQELPARVESAGLRAPTVILIGEVARFRDTLSWFETRPLFGRRVLVTRAAVQSAELAGRLRRRGAVPVCVPLLAFEPPEDSAPLERALSRLEEYDWLLLTSATAVRFGLDGRDLGARTSALPRVACIGPATARAARAAGLPVDVVPPDQALPERLVAELAARAKLDGARVLFPCAAGARELLPRALGAAGARVDRITAYRTVLPEEAPLALRKAVEQGLDAITLTSPSTVEHLFRALGDVDVRELARRAPLACIGPTTAAALRKRGLEPAVVCGGQTGDDLVEALERHLSRRPPDGVS
jgi:uroporphyrinogen III methyltransferase/synthase